MRASAGSLDIVVNNVAMDVCRSAVRLGADETYVLYRRSEAELHWEFRRPKPLSQQTLAAHAHRVCFYPTNRS